MNMHFLQEIERTTKKIKELKKEGCFCFNIIADSHVYPENPEWAGRQMHTFENLRAQNENAPIDAIFHVGDLFFTNCSQELTDYWNKEKIDEWFDIFRTEQAKANKMSFFAAGNHDSVGCVPPDRKHYYEKMIKPNLSIIDGYKENELYYYVDFPEKKVRAVILMSCFKEGTNHNYGILEEQVAWLRDEALLAPSGYSIFLFSHIVPQVSGLYHTSLDSDNEFVRFLWAFKNREKLESEKFSCDFRNLQTDPEIVALFVGHGHVDWIAKPSVLPFFVIETGSNHVHVPDRSNWNMPEDCTIAEREYGTVTEDLWDTVVFNPKERKIDIIRFGAGDDRSINF